MSMWKKTMTWLGLDPDAEYVLRGSLADAHMIGFGTFSGALGTPGGLQRDGYLESQALELDADGGFEIALSQREQPGNWLRMGPPEVSSS